MRVKFGRSISKTAANASESVFASRLLSAINNDRARSRQRLEYVGWPPQRPIELNILLTRRAWSRTFPVYTFSTYRYFVPAAGLLLKRPNNHRPRPVRVHPLPSPDCVSRVSTNWPRQQSLKGALLLFPHLQSG